MRLVVGLGNPGGKYENTRHNIGFRVLAELAKRGGAGRPSAKFDAEVAEVRVADCKVLLACPLTFMNASGRAVGPLVNFFKLPLSDMLVICDDLSLPLGKLRLRGQGSSGGQKGLQDIIRVLGGQDFPRLRLGIGATPASWDTADYVLGRFSAEESPVVEKMVHTAVSAVEAWVRFGLLVAMNEFNRDTGPQ
jgi:PTH1 family peptidyl-tRNA hydrolase